MEEYKLKVVLLGEGRVGKTSLALRYIHDAFDSKQASTEQASYLEKVLHVGKARVTLAVWDTAGQERYHALGPLYYKNADGAVLVYDVTDRDSLAKVRDWVRELRRMEGPDLVLCIAGNKVDRAADRVVFEEEASEFAASVGAVHVLTSAKTGVGVEEVFMELTRRFITGPRRRQDSLDDTSRRRRISIVDEPVHESGCCK